MEGYDRVNYFHAIALYIPSSSFVAAFLSWISTWGLWDSGKRFYDDVVTKVRLEEEDGFSLLGSFRGVLKVCAV